jgi:hypothetical protein
MGGGDIDRHCILLRSAKMVHPLVACSHVGRIALRLAHSDDGDQPFRRIATTCSGRPGSLQEGPARDAACCLTKLQEPDITTFIQRRHQLPRRPGRDG